MKTANDSLGGISQFIVDETTGKISGYKTEIGGADTVFPFSGESEIVAYNSSEVGDNKTLTITVPDDYINKELYLINVMATNGNFNSLQRTFSDFTITETIIENYGYAYSYLSIYKGIPTSNSIKITYKTGYGGTGCTGIIIK